MSTHPMSGGNDLHEREIAIHLERINKEFRDGFEFLKQYPKSVTVFGSSLVHADHPDYAKAEALAGRIVRELKYTVISGGGPGIMEAASKGAYEAGGVSIGFNISLPHERKPNAYLTHSMRFAYFFSRKAMMTFAAEAFIFFPGGFGTFDELFSILTLIQTEKIPRVPIILFDSQFWTPLMDFIKNMMLKTEHTIDATDPGLAEIADSPDRVIEIIAAAPVSEWWRNIN